MLRGLSFINKTLWYDSFWGVKICQITWGLFKVKLYDYDYVVKICYRKRDTTLLLQWMCARSPMFLNTYIICDGTKNWYIYVNNNILYVLYYYRFCRNTLQY